MHPEGLITTAKNLKTSIIMNCQHQKLTAALCAVVLLVTGCSPSIEVTSTFPEPLVEALPQVGGYKVHADKLKRLGVPVFTSHTVVSANGSDRVESSSRA